MHRTSPGKSKNRGRALQPGLFQAANNPKKVCVLAFSYVFYIGTVMEISINRIVSKK